VTSGTNHGVVTLRRTHRPGACTTGFASRDRPSTGTAILKVPAHPFPNPVTGTDGAVPGASRGRCCPCVPNAVRHQGMVQLAYGVARVAEGVRVTASSWVESAGWCRRQARREVQSPPGAISLVGDAPRSRQDGQGGSRVRMTRVPMIPTAWARTTCPLRFQSRGMYRTPSCSWQGFEVSCCFWFTIVNTSPAGTARLMVVAESPSREDLLLGDFAFRPSSSLSHAVTAAGHLAESRIPTPRHARRPSVRVPFAKPRSRRVLPSAVAVSGHPACAVAHAVYAAIRAAEDAVADGLAGRPRSRPDCRPHCHRTGCGMDGIASTRQRIREQPTSATVCRDA
jgi:hypothetical protein